MARIRSIKPTFFLDEDVAALQPLDRLVFIGLWCYADKGGRLEDRAGRLAVQILPFEQNGFEARLCRLADRKFIIRYPDSNGNKLIQIRSWDKHQQPHHTEHNSKLEPYKNGSITVKEPLNNGALTPKGGGGRGEGGRGKGEVLPPTPTHPPSPLVDAETWQAFQDMRKKLKAPLTPHAEKLILAKLDTLAAQGYPHKAVLEQSIERGWKGVFPLKDQIGNGGARPEPSGPSAPEGDAEGTLFNRFRLTLTEEQIGGRNDRELLAAWRKAGRPNHA